MKKAIRRIAGGIAALTVVLGIAVYGYARDYYRADSIAQAAQESDQVVSIAGIGTDRMAFLPEDNAEAGVIFYPGGKVEYTAYAPLLRELAERGILCVAVEMPLNLAVFNVNAAEGIRELYPEIQRWYIAGHSLGGAMAAAHAADHAEHYEGLVLLAAYAANDLRHSGLKVISLYGSEDGVLDLEKYAECRENLPEDAVEVIISGGNDAQFGSYGLQDGDGAALIAAQAQTEQTAEAVADFVLDESK